MRGLSNRGGSSVMSCLQITLLLKIIVTLALWAVPLLFAPQWAAMLLGMPEPQPVVLIRLLGAAFIALVVGYARSLIANLRGEEVTDTVIIGIVSNGLACIVILLSASEWQAWAGTLARAFMWTSAATTFLITAALFACGALPSLRRARRRAS
jgi:hypothetical protein